MAYLLLGSAWAFAAAGGGVLLALLARQAHPALSFRKLWAFYAGLLALGSAAFFAIGIG